MNLTKLLSGFALLIAVTTAKAAVMCTAGVASFPTLDPTSTSAALGDYTSDCSGGAPTDPALSANFQVFYNAALLTTATPLLVDGVNSYNGIFSGANSVVFTGVSVNPVSDNFVLQNVLVNPSLVAENFLYTAFLSISSATPIPVSNPSQAVAVNGVIGNTVPEPSAIFLLVIGMGLLLATRMRRHG